MPSNDPKRRRGIVTTVCTSDRHAAGERRQGCGGPRWTATPRREGRADAGADGTNGRAACVVACEQRARSYADAGPWFHAASHHGDCTAPGRQRPARRPSRRRRRHGRGGSQRSSGGVYTGTSAVEVGCRFAHGRVDRGVRPFGRASQFCVHRPGSYDAKGASGRAALLRVASQQRPASRRRPQEAFGRVLTSRALSGRRLRPLRRGLVG